MQKQHYIGQLSFGAYGHKNIVGTIEELKNGAGDEGAPTLWIYLDRSGDIKTIGHYVWDEGRPSNYRRVSQSAFDQECARVYRLTKAEKNDAGEIVSVPK